MAEAVKGAFTIFAIPFIDNDIHLIDGHQQLKSEENKSQQKNYRTRYLIEKKWIDTTRVTTSDNRFGPLLNGILALGINSHPTIIMDLVKLLSIS